MSLMSEPDVVRFRLEYYSLLARLLSGEPDEALLQALREGVTDRAVGATQVHPLLGEGWREIAGHVAPGMAAELEDEYTRTFLGPTGRQVHPYESYYLTGRLYDQPLSEVRRFMARLGLEPSGVGRKEPEDGLDYELSIMARLIERQQTAGDADPAALLEPQREFLQQHLLVWGPACAAEIEGHPGTAFYRAVGHLLRGFLEVERDFFGEEEPLEVPSLHEARERYHTPDFSGPVFDPQPGGPPAESGEE